MKQKFTLTAAILTLIEFVCLCVPFSLVEVIYRKCQVFCAKKIE